MGPGAGSGERPEGRIEEGATAAERGAGRDQAVPNSRLGPAASKQTRRGPRAEARGRGAPASRPTQGVMDVTRSSFCASAQASPQRVRGSHADTFLVTLAGPLTVTQRHVQPGPCASLGLPPRPGAVHSQWPGLGHSEISGAGQWDWPADPVRGGHGGGGVTLNQLFPMKVPSGGRGAAV